MKTSLLILILSVSIINWRSSPTKSSENDLQRFGTYHRQRDVLNGQALSNYELVQRALHRQSLKLKISSLKEVASKSEVETRVWVGFGLAYPRCFILKRGKERQTAVFITAKPAGAETLMTETSLDSPKSGWTAFDTFLKDQGISSPLRLALDDKHLPDDDEEIIAVEIRSGASYSMVFFPTTVETTDGKKVLAVCHRIEREFNIQMGCSYQP